MRPVYRVAITPDDVGKRVTVRARTGDRDGPPATDTVGVLLDWRDETLHIERRDGTVAEVAEERLLAARVVPAPPPRRHR